MSSASPAPEQAFDAIIIGSGLGGLAAASSLTQLANMRCLIIEQHWVPGGMTHQFQRRGGHWFTSGTHYVGQMDKGHVMRVLMDFVTGGVEWDPLPPEFDRFCFKADGRVFAQPTGSTAWRERLTQWFPQEAQALARYFKDIRAVYSWYNSYFLGRAMGGAPARFFTAWTAKRRAAYAAQTCQQYMDANFEDRRLKGLLCALWGDYGLLPESVTFMQHALVAGNNFEGTWYPRLGSRALAKGALKLIEGAGGRLLLCTRALEILCDSQGAATGVRVERRDGTQEIYSAPIIVSAVGAYNTFRTLLNPPLHPELERQELRHAGQAVISVWLGLDASPADLWGMAGENYWISSDYEHERAGLYHPGARKVHYAFLSCSGLKEKYGRHAHSLEICLFTNPLYFQKYATAPPEEYNKVKERIADDAVAFVDQFVPGLQRHVTFAEVGTPVTWENFCGWPGGTMYGVPPTGARLRAEEIFRPTTGIKGLWLAGCDSNVFGLAGSMLGGFLAAGLILRPTFGGLSFLPAVHRIMRQPGWAKPIWPRDAIPLVFVGRQPQGTEAALLTFELPKDRHGTIQTFLPGQHLVLLLEIDRAEVQRCYSICSVPDELPTMCLLVKRVRGGVASPYLVDEIQPGTTIHALHPKGHFVLDADQAHVQTPASVFIGAGSGLAPLVPMLRRAVDMGHRVLLVSCNRSPEEEPLHERARLALATPGTQDSRGTNAERRVTWRRQYSRLTGRITPEELQLYVRQVVACPERHSSQLGERITPRFYVCGPGSWMAMVRDALQDLGWEPETIREECFDGGEAQFDFGAAGRVPSRRAVTLEMRDHRLQTVVVNPGQTVLDAAESVALPIPAGCRTGMCGTCRATLRSGTVLDIEDGLLESGCPSVRTCRITPLDDKVVLTIESM